MVTAGLFATAAGLDAAEAGDLTFFENRIRPVLSANCFECHSEKSERLRGGLRLDTKADLLKGGIDGAVVVPGEPEASLLIKAIRHEHPQIQMPPPKSGREKLPEAVIRDFTEWVRMGVPYADAAGAESAKIKLPWSLEPVTDPELPAVKDAAWPRNSVDAFVLARMETAGAAPSVPADKRTLIRRVTFDLIGLPPSPEEVAAFLADESPDAFAKAVERLLASPHYGEHWGRHWLDVVRYADTAGDTADYPLPDAWRYRNYVIASFNADKPYDEFIREQIAGDLMARQEPSERYAEQVTATGFLALSRRFGFDSENYHHLTIQDTIDTLGQSVMGLTLGCARCHHHKFDPVTMRDYYGLYGIFASTRYAFPGSEQKNRCRVMTPLVPLPESDAKMAALQSDFAAEGLAPEGILRSLDDHDGDFEIQKPAAGGSYGVLVPPWIYEGSVSVSGGAQSPFRNVYPFGSAGAHLPADSPVPCVVRQTMHTPRRQGLLHVSVDFRAAADAAASGHYRFTIGPQRGAAAIAVLIGKDSIILSPEHDPVVIPLSKPGDWHSLQLTLDLTARRVSGSAGRPGAVSAIDARPLAADWLGVVNTVALTASGKVPGLDVDNIGWQTRPMAAVSTAPAATLPADPSLAALQAELAALSGFDGDLEGQHDGQPPAQPWHPGPNSVVKISAASQSPFRNLYPVGKLGISLPNSGDYNGLGLNLPREWKADNAGPAAVLHVAFDFRCVSDAAGGDGTWRFHLGHGPGSAAVELGFNRRAFFRRSGDARDEVAPLSLGEWYQVRLTLDLKTRRYTGSVGTRAGSTPFSGDFASGWDGSITYAFIDSGGHLNGVKPSLDADNFTLGTASLPPLEAPEVQFAGDERIARQARIAELRQDIESRAAAVKQREEKLREALNHGPVPLAYAVSDGTPQDARIQLRGEPDKPGDLVPRGFIAVLGGASLPAETEGSGRRELAAWLTRRDHPLTARVMVNRIWQKHFGRPLVRTPNDFGNRSEPPTHPELLDHLATAFMKSGWSVKAMHRLILLSATWQQAAASGPDAIRQAELYAGFPRRRLSAEELRDAILTVSGQLDRQPGGAHPFPPATSWGYSQHVPFAAVYDHRKRSVYLMVQRLKRHPYLALFDGADPNASTAERRVTTVPTQALYFLNDPFVHESSLAGADSLRAAAADEAGQIALAMQRAFGRPPQPDEAAEAIAFLAGYSKAAAAAGKPDPGREALAAFLRTLFGSNEFLHCD